MVVGNHLGMTPMADLTTEPGPLKEQYLLKTGGQVVGDVHLIQPRGLPTDGKWSWSTAFVSGGGRDHGIAETRHEAELEIRNRFVGWLKWANLSVRED